MKVFLSTLFQVFYYIPVKITTTVHISHELMRYHMSCAPRSVSLCYFMNLNWIYNLSVSLLRTYTFSRHSNVVTLFRPSQLRGWNWLLIAQKKRVFVILSLCFPDLYLSPNFFHLSESTASSSLSAINFNLILLIIFNDLVIIYSLSSKQFV